MEASGKCTVKVLIAEDDDWMREMLGLLLADEGLTPVEARSGPETVAVAREQCPDVIVLDVGLPGRSGFEVLAQLRKGSATRDTPVLLVSGNINIHESGHAFEAEAVFHKPLDFREFLDKLRELAPT
jgi:twitching motility two-component system response regulator PilH